MSIINPKELDITKFNLEKSKSCLIIVNRGKAHVVNLPDYGTVSVAVQKGEVATIRNESTYKIQ